VSLTNPDGEKAYPIASFHVVLAPQGIRGRRQASALVKFVWWAETEAQAKAEPLGYAHCPSSPAVDRSAAQDDFGRRQAGLDDGSSVTLQTTAAPPRSAVCAGGGFFSRPAVTVS